MSSKLKAILSLFFRTPQAHDDNFLSQTTGLTEDTTGTVFLPVTANDSGKAKALYSIDDGSSGSDFLQLLSRDTARTEAATSDTSVHGAKIWITTDGRVAYDAGSWSAAFRSELQHLAAGEYAEDSFIYAIQTGNGTLSWAQVTLQIAGVNDAPVATASANSAIEGGAVVIGQLSATDVDHGAILTYGLVDPAPAGLQLTAGGAYTFDPTVQAYDHLAAGAAETVVTKYRVTDEHGASATSTLSITVTGTNDAPVALADVAATDEDQRVTIDVLANDTDVDDGHVLTLVSATTPDGKGAASIDGNTLVFDPGTAFQHLAQGETEIVRIAYTMRDEHGAASNSFVDVTVMGANHGPVAVDDSATGGENDVLAIDVLANDSAGGVGHTLTVVSATAPEGKGTASVDANMVVFDPGAVFDHLAQGTTETVRLSYTMQDEHGASSSAYVDVTLKGENDAPVAAGDVAATGENQLLGIDVLANDTDVDDGHVLTVASAAGVAGKGTVANDGSKVLFAPGTDFDHLAQGESENVTLSYTTTDEHGATSSATVQLTVVGENDAPLAAADTTSGGENERLTIDVLANDTDVDDGHVLTLVSTTTPAGKGMAGTDGNSIVFDPGTAFDHLGQGTTETVRLSYTMQDEHGASSSAFVDVTLTGENDAPVALGDAAGTGENQSLAIDVLANDTDADDGHVLTLVSATALDGKGSAGVEGNQVVFAPGTAFDHLAQGSAETVRVAYTIQDEHGAPSTSFVDVTVTGENDAPVAGADAASGGENQRVSIDVLANDTDVDDGHVLTVVSATAPQGDGSATIEGNTVVFDPGTAFDHLAQGTTETVRLSYTMQDEHGASSSAFVDVTLTGENDAPVALADSAAGAENEVLTIDVLANDTDVDNGHVLSVFAASAPAGFGSASIVGNQVVFDPGTDFDRLAVGASETVQLSYTVQDEHGARSDSTIAITVNGVNDAPVGRDDTASTDEETAVNGNVLTAANGGADSDVDGDALSVATVGTFTTALGGTISLAANGAFTYDPSGSATLQALDAGQSAVDTFKYSLSDGHGGTDSATLSVTVAGVNAPAKGSVVLSSIESGTSFDYYIRFDGAGVTDGWLKLDGFSQSFNDASAGTMTISGVQMSSNSAMPGLVDILASGTHLNGVEIEAYIQGTSQLVDQYSFADAVLTSLQVSDFGSTTPDSIGFNFGGFAHSHQEFDANGAVGPVTAIGWDLVSDMRTSAPAHAADAVATTLTDVPGNTPLSYFITFDGAPGWLQVSSFSTGISGGAAGPTAEDAILTLGSSKQFVELTQTLFTTSHLNNVEVEAYRMDGAQPQLVDEYKFGDVTLSGLSTSNATDNSLNFSYAKYAQGHIAYDAAGAQSTITTGGWDFTSNTAIAGDTPVADAVGNSVNGGVAPGTGLDYYIRFDGVGIANSWLKLGGFNHSFAEALGGTSAAGQVTAADVTGRLGSNGAMPDLSEMLANGTHLNGVEIEAYIPGTAQLVDQYFFSNAVLTRLGAEASNGFTTDTVSFDFGSLAHSHREGIQPVTSVSWDFANAAPGSVPAYTADAAGARLADSLPQAEPLSYFVTYDGAPGWLEMNSFSTALRGGNGQASADDVMLGLGSSKELLQLTQTLFSGQKLTGVEVEAYRMGTKPQLVDEYKFQDVTLTALDTSNASANRLSFDYTKYAEGHIAYDANGTPTTITTGGWDFNANAAFSGGTPVANAIGHQSGGVAPGMELELYIHFESGAGLNSWLKLDSFGEGFVRDGAGKVAAADFTVTLGSNSVTPELIELLANGTHLKGLEIEAYKPGTTQLVDQYVFSDAVLTGLDVSSMPGFTGDSLRFDFGGFAHSHQDGTGPITSIGWDSVNGITASAPAHQGDALGATLVDSPRPSEVPLSYFVTYDGAPGWLQVNSFNTGITAGTGVASAEDVMLALGSSKQLVELTQTLFAGKQLNSLEVEAYRMDGALPQLVDEYKFEGVTVNGLATVSPTDNTLSFSYSKYAEGHIAYDANGVQSTTTTGGWDFSLGIPFSGGTPHADIDFTA